MAEKRSTCKLINLYCLSLPLLLDSCIKTFFFFVKNVHLEAQTGIAALKEVCVKNSHRAETPRCSYQEKLKYINTSVTWALWCQTSIFYLLAERDEKGTMF